MKRGCSDYVKSIAGRSLKKFSEDTGVPVTTLRDWYNYKNGLFNLLILGLLSFEDNGETDRLLFEAERLVKGLVQFAVVENEAEGDFMQDVCVFLKKMEE